MAVGMAMAMAVAVAMALAMTVAEWSAFKKPLRSLFRPYPPSGFLRH